MKLFESILTKELFPKESLISTFTVDNKKILTDTFNSILKNKEIRNKFIDDLLQQMNNVDDTKIDLALKQTFQKDVLLSELSEEAKDYLFTLALSVTQKPLGTILKYLAQEDLKIPIDFSALKTIPEQYKESIEKATSAIQQEIEENTYNTDFPGINGYLEYLSLNLDRSTVGVANSTSLLMTYIKGELPKKTNFGTIEGYVYAAMILLVLSALTAALGPTLYKFGNTIYQNGGKSLGDKVYSITGTLIPGFRDTAKKAGDLLLKDLASPVGIAISSFVFIYETGNFIQDKIDSSDKEKFKEIGIDSFIPLFASLMNYYSIVQSRKAVLISTMNNIQSNDAILNSIKNKIEEFGEPTDENIVAIVNELKLKIKQKFKPELIKYFEKNLDTLKVSLSLTESNEIYGTLTSESLRAAEALSDNFTGISWFNRYVNPNEDIQDIILNILENDINFDEYTNKANPYMMLAGSLIYISVFDVCISMPEIQMLAYISPYSAFKPFDPTKYKINPNRIPYTKITELPKPMKVEFVEKQIQKLTIPEATGDLCGVFVTVEDKNGKLYKTKFADILFETGKAVIASDKDNFVKRFGMLMNSYSNVKLIVTGNADVTGIEGKEKGERGNIPLSGKRAVAILKKISEDADLSSRMNVKQDIKIYGKGAAFARHFKNLLDKGVKTSKLIQMQGKSDATKEKQIRKQLADDRRVEIYISFTEDDYTTKRDNQEFIKKYCEMQPNMENVNSMFELKGDLIKIKQDLAANFIYKENTLAEQ